MEQQNKESKQLGLKKKKKFGISDLAKMKQKWERKKNAIFVEIIFWRGRGDSVFP